MGYVALDLLVRKTEVDNVDDCAGIPRLAGCVRGVRPLDYEQWSQELRLASLQDATIDWQLGVYWFDANGTTNFHLSAPVVSPIPLNDYSARSEETHTRPSPSWCIR
ncbi:MAG: hypothetical protein HC809_09165 [Gammaproteobacteria bacterium]|nr:hypothetical protein [Gammaproteobacteria bacterium]